MIDFDISFIDNNSFLFEDKSDLVAIPVARTNLSIYLPLQTDSFETVNLFDVNDSSLPVQNLGDSAEINLQTLGYDFSLEDGVYRIIYNLILDDDSELCREKFFIKDNNIKVCKRELVEDLISNPDTTGCRACEATFFESVLQSAYDAIAEDKYKEAESFIEYLKDQCSQCKTC